MKQAHIRDLPLFFIFRSIFCYILARSVKVNNFVKAKVTYPQFVYMARYKILPFEKMKPTNVWHFCLRND